LAATRAKVPQKGNGKESKMEMSGRRGKVEDGRRPVEREEAEEVAIRSASQPTNIWKRPLKYIDETSDRMPPALLIQIKEEKVHVESACRRRWLPEKERRELWRRRRMPTSERKTPFPAFFLSMPAGIPPWHSLAFLFDFVSFRQSQLRMLAFADSPACFSINNWSSKEVRE
jgi:hypothetical protein